MRMWFRSLDCAADGTVGVDDLLDPLISVGLARTRNDVINLLGVALGEKEDDDPSITLNDLFQVLQRKEVSTQVERAHAAPSRPSRRNRQRAQQSPRPRRAVTVDGRAVEDALRCEAQARMASFFELLSGGPPETSGQQLTVPLIIASHRRQMLLQANCAPPGSAAHREGKLILDALARVPAIFEFVTSMPSSSTLILSIRP
ncbi:Hypothetical Protein FCC1311_010292 [Hondaea fermentalgiana]|uniref:Uncharacterized protein n=1 Tax=Hondaea fermentalgiana TaxID=2315210 RepID=A0A2R5G9S0_9STRA|nr:Hypothetical Protein FCC1311_010292 [Hondaea fermentalgiana]|eukprot:GBG24811.1 Hypothetical Protein FCC1311_010292 [Hondaea fermentalgiana]